MNLLKYYFQRKRDGDCMTDEEYLNYLQRELIVILRRNFNNYLLIYYQDGKWSVNYKNFSLETEYKFSDLFPYLDVNGVLDDMTLGHSFNGTIISFWNKYERKYNEQYFTKFGRYFEITKDG